MGIKSLDFNQAGCSILRMPCSGYAFKSLAAIDVVSPAWPVRVLKALSADLSVDLSLERGLLHTRSWKPKIVREIVFFMLFNRICIKKDYLIMGLVILYPNPDSVVVHSSQGRFFSCFLHHLLSKRL